MYDDAGDDDVGSVVIRGCGVPMIKPSCPTKPSRGGVVLTLLDRGELPIVRRRRGSDLGERLVGNVVVDRGVVIVSGKYVGVDLSATVEPLPRLDAVMVATLAMAVRSRDGKAPYVRPPPMFGPSSCDARFRRTELFLCDREPRGVVAAVYVLLTLSPLRLTTALPLPL